MLLTEQTFSTAGIPANSSTNENRSMSLAGASAGTYYAYVIVDNSSEVAQSNTSNDLSSGTAFTVQRQSGLVINPIFDSSITSDPQAARIEATINSAIAVYESNFSDLVTVTITFQKMASGLGYSTRYYQTFLYSDYRAALVSHATTADDAAALAHLPAGSANPVNNNQNVKLDLPLARALGFSAVPPPVAAGALTPRSVRLPIFLSTGLRTWRGSTNIRVATFTIGIAITADKRLRFRTLTRPPALPPY